jgi:hypothetical protein
MGLTLMENDDESLPASHLLRFVLGTSSEPSAVFVRRTEQATRDELEGEMSHVSGREWDFALHRAALARNVNRLAAARFLEVDFARPDASTMVVEISATARRIFRDTLASWHGQLAGGAYELAAAEERALRATVDKSDAPASQATPTPIPASAHATGTANVTVMPMTTVAGSQNPGESERLVSIEEHGSLADALLKNGFTEQQTNLVLGTLRNVRPSLMVERGAKLRILFGPARNADILIPYRMSIYDPDATGKLNHSATAALTDLGSYVLGLAPPAIVIDGVALGTPRNNRERESMHADPTLPSHDKEARHGAEAASIPAGGQWLLSKGP